MRCQHAALAALLRDEAPAHVDQLRRNVALHSKVVGQSLSHATAAQLRRAQRGPRLGVRPAVWAPLPFPVGAKVHKVMEVETSLALQASHERRTNHGLAASVVEALAGSAPSWEAYVAEPLGCVMSVPDGPVTEARSVDEEHYEYKDGAMWWRRGDVVAPW